MAYYHECLKCQGSLDPGEGIICDECKRKEKMVNDLEEDRGLLTSEHRKYFDNKKEQ